MKIAEYYECKGHLSCQPQEELVFHTGKLKRLTRADCWKEGAHRKQDSSADRKQDMSAGSSSLGGFQASG